MPKDRPSEAACRACTSRPPSNCVNPDDPFEEPIFFRRNPGETYLVKPYGTSLMPPLQRRWALALATAALSLSRVAEADLNQAPPDNMPIPHILGPTAACTSG